MEKLLFVLLISLFLIAGCSSEKQTEIPESSKLEMRKDADEFMSGLRDVLLSKIKNNGLVAAVSVCSDTAQVMTNNFGVQKGVYIKRVSFKYRNEINNPDEFETEGLKYFEQIKNEGKLDSLSEYVKVVEENKISYLRYMKPILVQTPCLNCHGMEEQIMPEVSKLINNKYKNDKAKNYQVGDLRGAISIQKVF